MIKSIQIYIPNPLITADFEAYHMVEIQLRRERRNFESKYQKTEFHYIKTILFIYSGLLV